MSGITITKRGKRRITGMKGLYIFTIIFLLVFTACSQAKRIEINLDKDFIKVFNDAEWTVGRIKVEGFVVGVQPDIYYFTNSSGSLVISPANYEIVKSYLIIVTNRKLILEPFKFKKGEKSKYYIAEWTEDDKEIERIYGNTNLFKLFQKHEYFAREYFVRLTKISDKEIALVLIYNTNIYPGNDGYLGFYDGKNLRRVYLSLSNRDIYLSENESFLFYDKESEKLYFNGWYDYNEPCVLFAYSLKDGSLKEIYKGNSIYSFRRVPGTDYLIFYELRVGVVLKRIK